MHVTPKLGAGPALPVIGRMLCALLLAASSGMLHAAEPALLDLPALRNTLRDLGAQARPPLLARADLLAPAQVADLQLAPDALNLLFRRRADERSSLWLRDLSDGTETRVLADADGVSAQWAGDGRGLWLADADGLAHFRPGEPAPRRIFRWNPRRQQRLHAIDPAAPAYALVSERDVGAAGSTYRILRVDARGRSTTLLESALPVRGLLLDSDGKLAFSATYEGSHYDTVIRRRIGGDDRELLRCRGIERCDLLAYAAADETLWLVGHGGGDRIGLHRWRQGRWQRLHQDPAATADANALLWNRQREDWLAVAYQPDRQHWYARDADTAAALRSLRAHLPASRLDIEPSHDARLWLVRASSAQQRHDQHFLYRPERDELQALFAAPEAPGANADQLAPSLPLRFRASDGRLLHAYLSLAPGMQAARLPLIALVHGGPFNRDRDGYDPLVQLLCNRGYAVLQVNFRGSTGYGLDYQRAAAGDFGRGRVLADIIDGLDAVLAAGIGERTRQAVIGHSFGGYASLLAASHHPQRFRFAFASAAPVDFRWSMQWIASNGGSALPVDGPPAQQFFAQHGVALDDPQWQARMQTDSPLARLSALQSPVELWAGAADDRVPLKSLIRYRAEAARLGKPVRLHVAAGVGHNPRQRSEIEALLYLVEEAAANHLGGALLPPSPELQVTLERMQRRDPH